MNDDTTFEELIEDYLEMFRNGTAPDTADFAQSHPGYTDRLTELLPLMVKFSWSASKYLMLPLVCL